MIVSLKQRKIKFELRIKLNHNIHTYFETIIYSADTSSSGHGHQI